LPNALYAHCVCLDEFHAAVASLTSELAIVTVSGEIDLHTAGRLEARIEEAGAVGAATVVVDLSETSFIDSTALSVLVRETKRLEGRGHGLVVVTKDPRTLRIVEVTGLGRTLRTYATLQDALSELAPHQPQLSATAR
jgi:anti-anti-sigma factor